MSNQKSNIESGKKIILTLGLIGLIINGVWSQKANFDFVVTPIAENVYSIISPSFGLPTPENKGWNSNSHFVVTEKVFCFLIQDPLN
jgi:cyclase